jgi:hypothetical protein
VPPDKFGTSFAHRSRKLDRFNLCSRVVLKLMGPVIGDHAAVDQLEIIKRHAFKKARQMPSTGENYWLGTAHSRSVCTLLHTGSG